MQDNIRIFFKDKIKFESIIKKSRSFNCTVNSEDIEKESSKIRSLRRFSNRKNKDTNK